MLQKLFKKTKKVFNFIISEVNIGGGFGIIYTDEDTRKPYSYFLDPMMEKIEEFSS